MTIRSTLTRQLGKDPGVYIHQRSLKGDTLATVARELGITINQARVWRLDASGQPLRRPRYGLLTPDGTSVGEWLKNNGSDLKQTVVISRLHKGWDWHRATTTPAIRPVKKAHSSVKTR